MVVSLFLGRFAVAMALDVATMPMAMGICLRHNKFDFCNRHEWEEAEKEQKEHTEEAERAEESQNIDDRR